MKKSIKIISILAMVLILSFSLITSIYAVDYGNVVSGLKSSTQNANVTNATNSISGTAGKLIRIMQTVGIIVGVIVLVVLGIKFMMGSAEEKAEYKKTFIPLIIGAIVLISAFSIAKFLFSALGE